MIIPPGALDDVPLLVSQVAVVGAGPGGITTALELARNGVDVLLIESGISHFDNAVQSLADAAEWDQARHVPMRIATRRQLGGASTIWGGRCVPYDEVDFDRRPGSANVEWPISYSDATPYFERACTWLVCGRPIFSAHEIAGVPPSIVPGLPDSGVQSSTLERWSLPTDFWRRYRRTLSHVPRIRVTAGLTCTRIVEDGETITKLECRSIRGHRVDVQAQFFIIAAGGLESTRLLLASPRSNHVAIGNHSDHLGRWYMGHCEGCIANVCFVTDPQKTIYGYERDIDGVYVRRRFTFGRQRILEEGLPNIAMWLSNWEPRDARHRSGVLSFAYMMLLSPFSRFMAAEAQRLALTGRGVVGTPYRAGEVGPVRHHLRNMVLDLKDTTAFALDFGSKRFLSRGRRAPGFFVFRPDNRYRLAFHGEHVPRRDSRVTLSEHRDSAGLPRLRIDLRFGEDDVVGVVRAHEQLDAHLRRHGVGYLEYLDPDPRQAVADHLGGGFHQVGTTRMARRPEDGVLDSDLRVYGTSNLFVASSSAFVTSGQANSTFMIVVMALRLADHVRTLLRPTAVQPLDGDMSSPHVDADSVSERLPSQD